MKTVITSILLIALAPLFMYTSCNKGHDHNARNCDDVICTMMFAAVSTEVQDANGNKVTLDEAYTIRTSTGEKITYKNSEGYYTVLDESYLKQLQNATDKFQFVGIKDGVKLVDEVFTISADCCHVSKVEGKNIITIR